MLFGEQYLSVIIIHYVSDKCSYYSEESQMNFSGCVPSDPAQHLVDVNKIRRSTNFALI